MDLAGMRECISSTLTANAEIRKSAEARLKQAEDQPGFIGALLDFVAGDPDQNVRLSSLIYLKNKVSRTWDPDAEYVTGSTLKTIPEDEKPAFRNRLIPLLITALPQHRRQLLTIISKIINYDFPERWPDYVDITLQLLQTNDAASVYAGLQCLMALCKTYRFKSKDGRGDFDRVTEAAMPLILDIANKAVNETSPEAGEMVTMILKAYKHTIYMEMAAHLRQQSSIVAWCTLFIKIVEKEVPPDALGEDVDERANHPWWKSKKWAYANLNRLFVRYGNPQTLSSNSEDYGEFAKNFITNFAPVILKAYLQQIDAWVAKRIWLSKICLSFIVAFMDECVKPKSTWAHLKDHMENLVAHVLFPLLCQTEDDLELFDSDPTEYIHRKLNFFEEASSPDVAATNFLNSVGKHRRKQTYVVLNFVNEVVNRYEAAPENEKNPVEKEGALRMIGTLSSIILGKKSPIADKVEYFFVRHVFPEFTSPHGYLRARACNVLEKFSELKFQDENNVMVVYHNILRCLTDAELPVRVEAALALHTLISHEAIQRAMQQNIASIMQQLLKLTNEVELDQLANVMEEFVEVFASELTPFAVELTEQLRDTYLRIIGEIIEKGSPDDDGILVDDKSITALGVLQTIGTLILTLESTPEVLLHLEQVLVPVIRITLENRLYDLYNEVFEIIDSCTFSAKSISPTMWMIFELVHKTFNDRAEIYVEDMLPALDNYVTYGSGMLKQNADYLNAIISIINTIFTHDRLGTVDRICGCKLAESVLLSLRGGHADAYLPGFIKTAMTFLTSPAEIGMKSYRIHLMEMVINCIYYNPAATLQVLEHHGWTNEFFTLWFTNIDNFKRVHDKKLSICAIVALLGLRVEQIPPSILPGWHRLLQGIVRLFDTLQLAIKNREEVTKDPFAHDDYADNESDGGWDEAEGAGEWDDDQDITDEAEEYLKFLESGNSAELDAEFGADDDGDDLEEESLIESQLDPIEPYTLFKDAFLALKMSQPQLYESITKPLSAEEQKVLEGVIGHAEGLEGAIAAAAALAANGG